MVLRRILECVSWLALAATLLPSCLFLANRMDLDCVKTTMLAATIVWFAVTPFWMQRKPDETAAAAPANVV
jgi:hypothetical protein